VEVWPLRPVISWPALLNRIASGVAIPRLRDRAAVDRIRVRSTLPSHAKESGIASPALSISAMIVLNDHDRAEHP
jgi:hypothetical protein